MTFRNTIWQGPWKWVLVATMMVLLGILIMIGVDDQASTAELVIAAILIGATVVLLAVMHNWIAIKPGQVRIGFFPLYRKTFVPSELKSVSMVDIQPFLHYGGLGIKGLAKSRHGLLLGGYPPRGLRFETTDDRRYIVTLRNLEPIVQELARHGCTLSAANDDAFSRQV